MTEQKPKKFGLIIKGAKTVQTAKQKEEKRLYTIISCCVGAIFLLTIFIPFLSKDEGKTSGSIYKNVAFDLADLAVDDQAEKTLLEMQKYSDIPKQKIAGGLFDKKEKEARQQADKKEGLPAAPDAEYQKARDIKQAKREKSRGVSRAPIYSQRQNTRTSTGNLAKGGMVSTSGGSSGVSASIWTSPDKAGQKGSSRGGAAGAFGTQQLVAATGAKGRASGLLRAIEESKKGAASQNADTAAQAAADAFTNNNIEAEEDEDLKDGMDEFAGSFNAEEFDRLGNDKELTDLADELNKKKDEKEEETDPCLKMANKMSFQCMWGPMLVDIAKNAINSLVDSGLEAAFGDSGTAGDTNWLVDHGYAKYDSQGNLVKTDKWSTATGNELKKAIKKGRDIKWLTGE